MLGLRSLVTKLCGSMLRTTLVTITDHATFINTAINIVINTAINTADIRLA